MLPDLSVGKYQELALAIQTTAVNRPSSLNVSPWVAMSLLQKAIRRDLPTLALRAASTLLENDEARLWRRIGCVAFEDVGLGDPGAVADCMLLLRGKRLRQRLGGEWPVASYLTQLLSRAAKCRAADDLLMSADLLPRLRDTRNELAVAATKIILAAAESPDIHRRALGLRYLLGTDRGPEMTLPRRKGEPQLLGEYLQRSGVQIAAARFALEGFTRTRSALPGLCALIKVVAPSTPTPTRDDRSSPDRKIREVPGWAYDLYSREGRDCLTAFLYTNGRLSRWINLHVAPPKRVGFLGSLVFRVEGQRCARRLRWPLAYQLRAAVDQGCHGPSAIEVLGMAEAELPLLNEVRAKCLS